MTQTETTVSNLKINKLTKQQYNQITPSDTELYMVTDDNGVTSSDVINALGYTPQAQLVSGTNIKTINNNSLLGSGNISISGGTPTDVQINGTSITNNNVANIVTNTAYDESSNKIATMSDVPSDVVKKDGGSTVQTISLSSGTGTTPLGIKSRATTSSYISFTSSTTWLGSIGVNSSKKPVFYNGTSYTLAYTSDIPTKVSDLTNDSGYTSTTITFREWS